MKKTICFIALTLFIFSCKKDRSFPNETQNGNNKFAWKINGEIRTANPGPIIHDGPDYQFTFYTTLKIENGENKYYGIYLGSRDKDYGRKKGGGSDYINFRNDSVLVKQGNSYKIGKGVSEIKASYTISKNLYYGDFLPKDNSGILTISRFDPNAKIISGIFSFDVYDKNGEKKEIREGRFDFVYDQH